MNKSIFLMVGPDDFLLSEHVEKFKKGAIEKYGEFSVDSFSFETHSYKEVRNEIFSPPFFGGKRVVLLENFPPSATPKVSESKKEQYLSLIEEFSELPEDVVLICVNSNPDKRTTIYKSLKKIAGTFYDHPSFDIKKDKYKIIEWIIDRFKRRGGAISQKNAEFLLHFSGENLRILDSEITKLSHYVLQKEIEEKDIIDLAIPSEEGGGDFAFSNALSTANISLIIKEFIALSQKHDPAMIFNRDVLSSFRNLLKSKLSLLSPQEPVKRNYRASEKLKVFLKSSELEKFLLMHSSLKNLDIESKTGKVSLSLEGNIFLLKIERLFYKFFIW
jgi:DNA polymerase-3 subunit delta